MRVGDEGGWKPARVRRREAGVEEGAVWDEVSREESRAESSASAMSSIGVISGGKVSDGFPSVSWHELCGGSFLC